MSGDCPIAEKVAESIKHPSEIKDDIVLLEAKQIAEGPSGRNSGFMIDLPHNLASGDYLGETSNSLKEIQSNRTAINFAKQMANFILIAKNKYIEQ